MSDSIPTPVLLTILQNKINNAVYGLNEWISVSSIEAKLDSRFNANKWEMSYNDKLKLLWFVVQVNPSESITGSIHPLFIFPRTISDGAVVNSEIGRSCIVNGEGLMVKGSETWNKNISYRFSGMLKIK